MAEQHQLNVLRRLTAATDHDQGQQPADNGVQEREQHESIFAGRRISERARSY